MNTALRELQSKRESLEQEADAIHSELMNPGPNGQKAAGINDPLTDVNGYPRSDIDVYRVRGLRNRLSIINTDYKNTMMEIEKELQVIHTNVQDASVFLGEPGSVLSQAPPPATMKASFPSSSSSSSSSNDQFATAIAMAKIDEVTPGSPADNAGLIVGDFLLQFGKITASNPTPRAAIPRELQSYVGTDEDLQVTVRRSTGETVTLQINLPEGVRLGCHLDFLNTT